MKPLLEEYFDYVRVALANRFSARLRFSLRHFRVVSCSLETIDSRSGIFHTDFPHAFMMNSVSNLRPAKSRLNWMLALLALVAIFGLVFWPGVRGEMMIRLVLSSEIPSQTAFDELIQATTDPVPFLERMWATEKIVHRQFVADYVKRQVRPGTPPDPRVEALLIAGAHDPDASVREMALGEMAMLKLPQFIPVVQTQLRDSDPEIRLLGLHYLSRAEARPVLPTVIRLLDDPELRVVTTAEATLKKWTGEDFGIRIHYAIPQMDKGDSEHLTLDPAKVEMIKQGVQRRKAWWELHKKEYPDVEVATATPSGFSTPRLATSDFKLTDLSGKPVRLTDFRGKIVLLNFWTTWCTACLTEIPDLIQLQKEYADRVVILGVSLDGVPDSHGHGEGHREGEVTDHGHDADEQNHKHDEAKSPALTKIRNKVERLIKAKGINYRILLDPKNELGGRFNGGELPTNVLIDGEGRVRRRFIGARPLPAWEAMIAEINGGGKTPHGALGSTAN